MKFAFAILAAGGLLIPPGPAPSAPSRVAALGHEFSGPYQFANLTMFLIHGADAAKASSYLTLGEALAAGIASVSERGQGAGSLRITNRSDRPIYLQSGDLAPELEVRVSTSQATKAADGTALMWLADRRELVERQ
ncbi:MAG: ARPP-1 family domain-containing protein [Planctomycetota bacterium]